MSTMYRYMETRELGLRIFGYGIKGTSGLEKYDLVLLGFRV